MKPYPLPAKPLCMTTEEFAAWNAANAQLWTGRAPSPCTDCLPAFAKAQRLAGTCDFPLGKPSKTDILLRCLWGSAA